jgi:serine protease Do
MVQKKYFRKIPVILGIIVALLGFGVAGKAINNSGAATATTAVKDAGTVMVPANFSDLAEKVRPGVVNIRVSKAVRNLEFGAGNPGWPFGNRNPFGDFGPFSNDNGPRRFQQGVGSGFVISKDGYVLTNNHVVDKADKITVKLLDGGEYTAKVVGRDEKTDLAVLKISGAKDLHALPLGDSDTLKVGSWVVAVGSPFGLEETVTAGIVSAKGRVIGSGPYDNFIQTDASINPGNSGGPLINMNGEVVGINTAIIASGQGIGFAIPIDTAKEIVPQLEQKGRVTRGWLGVGIQDITADLSKSFGLKDVKGALVAQVMNGGPAEKAGIQQGDVIVEFDGKTISDARDLSRVVASEPVGKTAVMKFVREGKTMDREVRIGELADKSAPARESRTSRKSLGISVQNLTPDIAKGLGVSRESGVVITSVEPGSPSDEAGLQPGDVILQVNRAPVKDAQDFVAKADKAKEQESVLLLVRRGQNNLFAAVRPR